VVSGVEVLEECRKGGRAVGEWDCDCNWFAVSWNIIVGMAVALLEPSRSFPKSTSLREVQTGGTRCNWW
jgi:hypothetical protein